MNNTTSFELKLQETLTVYLIDLVREEAATRMTGIGRDLAVYMTYFAQGGVLTRRHAPI